MSCACRNLFFLLRRVSSWFWLHFQRDVCWFWSGAGRFVLNLLVMEPTSALLHVSSSLSVRSRICQTSQLMRSQPPLHSLRSLRSSLSVLCGTAPCVSLVCVRVASTCPISASRRFALQRLCVASWFSLAGFLYSRCSCVLGWFPVLSVFSRR